MCISIAVYTPWLEVLKRTSSEPAFLSRDDVEQIVILTRVGSFGTNVFSFKRSVFVEKSGECVVVSVDKVIEISRRVSDEPRIGIILRELRDAVRFEASERE